MIKNEIWLIKTCIEKWTFHETNEIEIWMLNENLNVWSMKKRIETICWLQRMQIWTIWFKFDLQKKKRWTINSTYENVSKKIY